jgi:hypothetical protein
MGIAFADLATVNQTSRDEIVSLFLSPPHAVVQIVCFVSRSPARNYIDIYHNHNDAHCRLTRPLSERITRIAICCDKQSTSRGYSSARELLCDKTGKS